MAMVKWLGPMVEFIKVKILKFLNAKINNIYINIFIKIKSNLIFLKYIKINIKIIYLNI